MEKVLGIRDVLMIVPAYEEIGLEWLKTKWVEVDRPTYGLMHRFASERLRDDGEARMSQRSPFVNDEFKEVTTEWGVEWDRSATELARARYYRDGRAPQYWVRTRDWDSGEK